MAKPKPKAPKSAKHASAIEHADAAVAARLSRARKSLPVSVVGVASELADQPPLIAISLGTLAAGLVLRHPAVARAGLRMVASELVATAIKGAIKRRVDRTRPHKMLKDGRYALQRSKGAESDGAWSSFPSGHTAGVVAVGRAVSREFPRAAPASRAIMAAVGAVQVPRGAHFPTDVIAGAAIGWAAEALVDRVARMIRTRRADWLLKGRSRSRLDAPGG